MNGRMWRAALVAGTMAGFGLWAAPASAQATRTWVSGVGDDANPCSRTAPCRTFAGTISKTATGGEINCIDPGIYGAVTITKSVAIVCDSVEASISVVGGASGVTVNTPSGGTPPVVFISGITITGAGATGDGVAFVNGTSLVLENVKIRGFGGYGVRFEPAATASLTVKNVLLQNNGTAGTALSGGMLVRPVAGAGGLATITGTVFANNLNNGARIETLAGSTISATVVDTLVSNSGSGLTFRAPAGTGTINGTVNGATLVNNTGGLIGNGSGAMVRVGDSTIAANGTGVAILGGAPVTSFGDNRLLGNSTNGAFPTVTPKQ